MTPETIRRLDSLFASTPILVGGGPVPRDEVDRAEASVGMKFDPDYREFIERYGGAMVGSLPILGVRQAEVMGADTYSVSEVTAQFRSDGWSHTDQWVVISVDLGGNPIGLNDKGEVWVSDHDLGGTIMIAPTFEQFLAQQLDES